MVLPNCATGAAHHPKGFRVRDGHQVVRGSQNAFHSCPAPTLRHNGCGSLRGLKVLRTCPRDRLVALTGVRAMHVAWRLFSTKAGRIGLHGAGNAKRLDQRGHHWGLRLPMRLNHPHYLLHFSVQTLPNTYAPWTVKLAPKPSRKCSR
jgi:hypothetical protein